jgi:hypothetical protein
MHARPTLAAQQRDERMQDIFDFLISVSAHADVVDFLISVSANADFVRWPW